MATPKLFARLENIGVRYAPKIVLQNLSRDVVEGAITCVIGLSGAGKSTILRLHEPARIVLAIPVAPL